MPLLNVGGQQAACQTLMPCVTAGLSPAGYSPHRVVRVHHPAVHHSKLLHQKQSFDVGAQYHTHAHGHMLLIIANIYHISDITQKQYTSSDDDHQNKALQMNGRFTMGVNR